MGNIISKWSTSTPPRRLEQADDGGLPDGEELMSDDSVGGSWGRSFHSPSSPSGSSASSTRLFNPVMPGAVFTPSPPSKDEPPVPTPTYGSAPREDETGGSWPCPRNRDQRVPRADTPRKLFGGTSPVKRCSSSLEGCVPDAPIPVKKKRWSWPGADVDEGDQVMYQYVLTPNKFQKETRVFRVIQTQRGVMYDFREFEDGVPTTKGVELPPQRFVNLVAILDSLDFHIDNIPFGETMKDLHVGGNLHAIIKPRYRVVDLRDYWLPPNLDTVVPTRRGCGIRFSEWGVFKRRCLRIIQMVEPSLSCIQPCFTRDDHMNQIGYLSCTECNPNPSYDTYM